MQVGAHVAVEVAAQQGAQVNLRAGEMQPHGKVEDKCELLSHRPCSSCDAAVSRAFD